MARDGVTSRGAAGGGGRRVGSRRDRSRDNSDGNNKYNNNNNNARGGQSTNSSFNTSTAAINSPTPPDYYLHIRRAVRACVEDPDFVKALQHDEDEEGAGNRKMEVEEVLDAACQACDTVAQALPTSDPISFDALARLIKEIIVSHPKTAGNVAASNRFTVVFIQRVRQFLTKVEPPVQSAVINNNNANKKLGGDSTDSLPTEKRFRTESNVNSNNNSKAANTNNNNNNNQSNIQQPPISTGGILGDGPMLPPPNVPIFAMPPPLYTDNHHHSGVLHHPPPMMGFNNNYNSNNYNNNNNNNTYGNTNYNNNNNMHNNMNTNGMHRGNGRNNYNNNNNNNIAEPFVFKPAADIGTRYVTLRNIPQHIATREALKTALESIVATMGRHLSSHIGSYFFLNYDVFDECDPAMSVGPSPPSDGVVAFGDCEDGSHVVAADEHGGSVVPPAALDAPPATVNTTSDYSSDSCFMVESTAPRRYYAVVSFNTVAAASEFVAKVNAMVATEGSPVTAEGTSNPEEIVAFWGETRGLMVAMEDELLTSMAALDAMRPTFQTLEGRRVEILQEIACADAAIRTISAANDPAQKETLRETLKARLALNREMEEVLAGKIQANVAVGLPEQSTDLMKPDAFSSSSAQPSNPRNLIYITDIAAPLSDDKVLLVLQRLEVQAKHIWRDPSSHMVCVEVPVFGAVVGTLRKLDFLDCCFANMRFTNEKPPLSNSKQK